MADLPETAVFDAGIYQIETTDPVLGGAPNAATGAGMSNIPHLQLARRTLWLKEQVDAITALLSSLNSQIAVLSQSQRMVAPVLVATTANITLSGLQTIDGVSVTAGRRVLVKNQTTPTQNGVYIAASGAWARATDMDNDTDIVPGVVVGVTAGTAQADTLWIMNSPNEGDAIAIGSTPLTFGNVTALSAPIASPAFSGAPTAPTAGQFNSSTLLANTQFVQRALGNFSDAQTFTGSFTLTAADAGKCYVYGEADPATITLPAISAAAIGSTFEFINTGTANLTVQRAGADQIDSGPAAVNSIAIPPNQSLKLVRSGGSSLWHPVGITAQAMGSTLSALLNSVGWQRLPSGLIIQWGAVTATTTLTSYNYPISFPTAALRVVGGSGNDAVPNSIVTAANFTNSQFRGVSNIANAQLNWIAIGH
jgi:hypothetical protein